MKLTISAGSKPAQNNHSKQYQKYLKSEAWRVKRAQVLLRANGRCEHCKEPADALQAHHRHYRTLGREKLSDLVGLCSACHAAADDLRNQWSKKYS